MQRFWRNIEDLPAEVVEHAISYVPPKDLCSLMLTSSRMRTVSSNPKLWAEMIAKKEKINQNGLVELFSINRFSRIRKLNLNFFHIMNMDQDWEEEFVITNMNAINSSFVEELELGRVNFMETPPDTLALTAPCLRTLELESCHITSDQFSFLLASCTLHPSLSELLVSDTNVYNDVGQIGEYGMREVPAVLLGLATANLQKVKFEDLIMTSEQCIAIFESCIASSKLTELSLDVNLASVPSNLLGRATANLKKLSLRDGRGNLNTDQCNAILEACIASHSLIGLTLESVKLEEVTVNLLKRAARHLHRLDVNGSSLTTEQLIGVLETSIAVPTLDELSLAYLDLTEVPVDLFDRAAGHLSKMILDASVLTDEQKELIETFDSELVIYEEP